MTDDYLIEHNLRFDEIVPELAARAFLVFERLFDARTKYIMRSSYDQRGPGEWFHQDYGHFFTGMWVRNALRRHGLLDRELPSGNWDDYYIQLLEAWIV